MRNNPPNTDSTLLFVHGPGKSKVLRQGRGVCLDRKREIVNKFVTFGDRHSVNL